MEDKKNKYIEWGKLGGRPKKDEKKSERITLRYTPAEIKKLQEESEKRGLKLTEYLRGISLNRTFPDYEKNQSLIEFANNFQRLKNYIHSGIFTQGEKDHFLHELDNTIKGIRNEIKW